MKFEAILLQELIFYMAVDKWDNSFYTWKLKPFMNISGDYSHLGHLISLVKFRALFKNHNLFHNLAEVLNSICIYTFHMRMLFCALAFKKRRHRIGLQRSFIYNLIVIYLATLCQSGILPPQFQLAQLQGVICLPLSEVLN